MPQTTSDDPQAAMTTQTSTPSLNDRSSGNAGDAQRTALRDLVVLAADAAAAEVEIDKNHRSELKAAEKQLEAALASVAERTDAEQQSVLAEYEQRVARAEGEMQAEFAQLEAHASAARQHLAYQDETTNREVKQKLQQAIWLAESLFEATQNQIVKDYKKAKEDHAARLEELTALQNEALATLAKFGQPGLSGALVPAPELGAIPKYVEGIEEVKRRISEMQHLQLPRLFIGVRPFLLVVLICGLATLIAQGVTGGLPFDFGTFQLQPRPIAYALGGSLAFCALAGVGLRMLGNAHVRGAYVPLRDAIERSQRAADAELDEARQRRDTTSARAARKRDLEVQATREKFAPLETRAAHNREAAARSHREEYERRHAHLSGERARALQQATSFRDESLARLLATRDAELKAAREAKDAAVAQSEAKFQTLREALRSRWNSGLAKIQRPIASERQSALNDGHALVDWNDPKWESYSPPRQFPDRVRFGELKVDLPAITDRYPRELALPPEFSVPAELSFPSRASIVIHTDHAGRAGAIRTQQMLMARLLTQLPAGRVRFTIIDPVGLGQNFAGFMHLADHDEALVGSRIWTETEHIEQQLANLTEHMETVIQKYLRNEFATIDDYNAQAGELAEPYRYLVVADFPVGFEGDAYRRLNSIATSGARCGVFFIIVRDTRQPLQSGVHLDELNAHAINLVRKGDHFSWDDEIFKQFPLALDPPPSEAFLTRILDVVGREAKAAKRVEVPFESIAPTPQQMWSGDSSSELSVPIGRLGATRLQQMKLGRGVAQHALIAGKTGSGKSTLLHVLVTNLALWYGPDHVEFYLVDFKKGVEFKTYATQQLPHARAIAVESDREFGLSVLQRIDGELARRGEMFRRLGVQDLAAYRQESGKPLPRTLLIIDEFQEFFSEDDKLAQEAGLLLDRLVRQGRAFGIHVLLGSQTIGGTSGLARSTIGQMAVRVALQTSEADSQLILGDANSAARLLSRPGEAIYNDAGGSVEANSPFQISWLSDAQRETYLARVHERAETHATTHAAPPVVFEGNAPADIFGNKRLVALVDSKGARPTTRPTAPVAWVGDPVAIKDPTAIALREQSGANAIIIGQYDESAMALIASAIVSLAAQHTKTSAKFYLLDGTPADSPLAGRLGRVVASIPQESHLVEWRNVEHAVNEVATETARRQALSEHADLPAIYLFVYGLQRYRMLRKSEESFSFSMEDAGGEKKPQSDKQFADILRDGPQVGVHVITWIDTAASLERTLERGALREFDHRILFQMSAADSSNLIDSPNANKLGVNRALAYSEEQGVMEKFRPYALPSKEWLERVARGLAS